MPKATLLILNGPSRGTRYDLLDDAAPVVIGRSVGTHIRVDDTEMSRRHAQIFFDGTDFRIKDLGSANGTLVNSRETREAVLRNGDRIRLGNTRFAFQLATTPRKTTAAKSIVQIVDDSGSAQQSAIIQQLQAGPTSSMTIWPEQRQGLELLRQVAEELVRPAQELDAALARILDLTLETVRADRGCILLREPGSSELTPAAFRKRGRQTHTGKADQMPISRTITGYVLQHGRAVRTSDAAGDTRFDPGNSILSSGIREAICAPMRGHEDLIGVVYLDITTEPTADGLPRQGGRLTDEHLKSVLAVARQCALAVESRRFHDAFLQAERFAAMGQTVAVLSHHIKNILQGVKGGGYLIKSGLDQSNEDMVRQGWNIIERNQDRIYDLVMDMLSFSKDRVPDLAPARLNDVCAEVIELAQTAADEYSVQLDYRPDPSMPLAEFDREGIHRAVLNIVRNAIDAVAEKDDGHVIVQTAYDRDADVVLVAITDNGPGIPEDQRSLVFNVFESSKGSRGTGIGLPVSRKIIREHGGQVRIEGGPGEGTRFVVSWPRGNPTTETIRLGAAQPSP